MRAARLWFLLPLVLVVGGSAALDRPARPEAKPAARPEEKPAVKPALFEALLEDRSVVRLALLQAQIQVNTPYGTLDVPAEHIRHIDFTPRPVPDVHKRVAAAVEKLRNDVFAEREAGTRDLLTLGPASYWPLVAATRAEDLEVKKRAQSVLGKLEKKFPPQELRRKPHDLIQTPTFTIAGLIHGATLKVKSAYFGETQLKLGDLRSLRSLGSGREVTVAVDASRYAMPPGTAWLETNVTIRARSRLVVQASGEIDMYPLPGSIGQYRAGPDGPKWAGGGALKGGGGGAAGSPGILLGRIGTSGKEFVIGARYEGLTEDEGVLYLRIVPSPWNNASTGEYKVTIRVD